MAYLLREGNITILHCDGDKLRAAFGVQEFLARPTVTVDATYAIPRASSSKPESSRAGLTAESTSNGDGHANGSADVNMDGDAKAEVEVEGEGEKRVGWIIGDELNKAKNEERWEEKYEQKWPFRATSSTEDWEGRAYVITHVLTLLGLNVAANTSPLLLVPPPSPPSFPLPHQAAWAQLAFEDLSVPALSILPAPLASLYAVGATTGIVLHVGRDRSEIAVVTDSVIRWECSTTVDVGYGDCEVWFEDLLMKDADLDKNLQMNMGGDGSWEAGQKEKLIKEVANFIWTECTGDDLEVPPAEDGSKAIAAVTAQAQEDDSFDVAKKLVGDAPAAAASHKKKSTAAAAATAAANKAAADAVAAAAADVITINIPSLPEKEITVGQVRHRLCEPLLRGKNGGDTVWEGMGRAISNATMSPAEKMAVWEGVVVVGETARIKSFSPALLTHLAPFLLSSSDLPSDVQPSRTRLLSIPDYFSNYKGSTTELAPFLGGSMAAKVVFSDQAGKHSITKVDYNAKGPAVVYSTFDNVDQ